jgi:hypothetical protein
VHFGEGVSPAKVAVVDSGELGRSAVYGKFTQFAAYTERSAL